MHVTNNITVHGADHASAEALARHVAEKVGERIQHSVRYHAATSDVLDLSPTLHGYYTYAKVKPAWSGARHRGKQSEQGGCSGLPIACCPPPASTEMT